MALVKDLIGESHYPRSCTDFGRAESRLTSVQNSPHDSDLEYFYLTNVSFYCIFSTISE